MWLFIYSMLLGDKNYREHTEEFKIKGDNSVNDAKIQEKLLDFQCGLSLKSRQIGMYDNTFHHIDPQNNLISKIKM